MALHRLTEQMHEQMHCEQVEWSLAVVLTAMSDAALHGLSIRRSQTVVEHLACVAADEATTPSLRNACDKLICFWEDIHLQ
jgi:hypothetical protein